MKNRPRTSRREISPETERRMHELFERFASRPAAPESTPETSGNEPESRREA